MVSLCPGFSFLFHSLLLYRSPQWTCQAHSVAFAPALSSACNGHLLIPSALISYFLLVVMHLIISAGYYLDTLSKTGRQKGVAGWGCHIGMLKVGVSLAPKSSNLQTFAWLRCELGLSLLCKVVTACTLGVISVTRRDRWLPIHPLRPKTPLKPGAQPNSNAQLAIYLSLWQSTSFCPTSVETQFLTPYIVFIYFITRNPCLSVYPINCQFPIPILLFFLLSSLIPILSMLPAKLFSHVLWNSSLVVSY